MPFPDYQPEIQIVITHQWHPGSQFIFTFPKRLPQAAIDAEQRLLGLGDKDRDEQARLLVIETVAEMSSKPPRGFPGFPEFGEPIDPAALKSAIITYFDEPLQPELEAIITSAWSGYRAAARPAAYAKSLSPDGEADGDTGGAAPKTQSG